MWLQLGLLARLKVDVALIALLRRTSGGLVALSVAGRDRHTTIEEVRRSLRVPFLLSRWIDDAASVWEVLENLGGRALAQPEAAESERLELRAALATMWLLPKSKLHELPYPFEALTAWEAFAVAASAVEAAGPSLSYKLGGIS